VDIPVELKYTEAHEWVRTGRDGVWTVVITHHAQDALGEIVQLNCRNRGKTPALERRLR
jgi:glycine cleavage system H protein